MSCVLAAPAKSAVLVEVLEEEERVPPVPILKQINEVHDDGSYTFGFEAGDGSFRVETKDPSGHVKGKYGYIDEFGQQQVLGQFTYRHLLSISFSFVSSILIQ